MADNINLFQDEDQKLRGIVQKIIFAAQETNYAVFSLELQTSKSLITVTTKKLIPLVGQEIRLEGRWVTHPRFGDQFEASSIEISAPTDEKGIERFLASGAIKGIGAKLAHSIVNTFGKDALKVIETSPKKLSTIKGISLKKAEKIQGAYTEQSELKEIMLWLEQHGTSGIYAGRIFQTYGSMSLTILEKEPYRLTREVRGIGFLTVDSWMQKDGREKESTDRILAGISYTLYNANTKGHMFLPENILKKETTKLLRLDPILIHDTLQQALQDELFSKDTLGERTFIYQPTIHKIEKDTATMLLALKDAATNFSIKSPLSLVENYAEINIELTPKQKNAIVSALTEGVLVITGGPGTGKTTIVRAIIDILTQEGKEVALTAPTGRAAKRLEETTGKDAMTIHRLLEAQGTPTGEMVFVRNEDYPLELDALIIDEASMIDNFLLYHLLNALPKGTHIIFVGDADQLPSVGAGKILHDIIASEKIPTVFLKDIFRQKENSQIILSAHLINQGRLPALPSELDKEFVFLPLENALLVAQKIVQLAKDILQNSVKTSDEQEKYYQALATLEILSPMHKGVAGVENLNRLLQDALNKRDKDKEEITIGINTFRTGDKVMQNKNNYDKEVFNGDIGFIVHIDDKILVNFGEGKVVPYTKQELSEIQLAYAMTVHKSQGGEYDTVIIPILKEHYIMLQRNLIYTAITRSKKKVIILGHKEALRHATENNREVERYTLLTERLRELVE